MNLRNSFLYLLIASVSISALIGIFVIVLGEFSETELRILGTTLTITVLSILGLSCGAAYESGFNRVVTISGIVVSVAAACLWILIIWSNSEGGEYVVKAVLTITLLATAFAYVSLISFARLDERFRWVRWIAHISVSTLVGFLLYIIWIENNPNENFAVRFIGTLSILLAALTISLPVFHILSKGKRILSDVDSEILDLETRLERLRAERDSFETEDS